MDQHQADDLRFADHEIAGLAHAAASLEPLMKRCAADLPDFAGLELRAVDGWRTSVLRSVRGVIALQPPESTRDAAILAAAAALVAVGDGRRAWHTGAMDQYIFRCRLQPGLLVAWTPTAAVALRSATAMPSPPALWRSDACSALRRTADAIGEDAVLLEEEPLDSAHARMREAHFRALLGGPEAAAAVQRHAGFDPAAPQGRVLRQRIVGDAALLYVTHAKNPDVPAIGSVLAAVALDQ